MRKFEVVTDYKNKGINLPIRSTAFSAGYDIEAAEDTVIPALTHKEGQTWVQNKLVPTGLKVACEPNEYVKIVPRSSMYSKKGLLLANNIGIIDSDYYNNSDNEGHIFLNFLNMGSEDVRIQKGERLAQAIFQKYEVTDDDLAQGERQGGFGSTDK